MAELLFKIEREVAQILENNQLICAQVNDLKILLKIE